MKKILIIFFLGSTVLSAGQMNVDDTKGFRDIFLGEDVGKYPDLVLLMTFDEKKGNGTYYRSGENLVIDGVAIVDVAYNTYGDKIYEIIIETKDMRGFDAFVKVLRDRYGKETSCNFVSEKSGYEYVWEGEKISVGAWNRKIRYLYKSYR